jgi:hypothetical protein
VPGMGLQSPQTTQQQPERFTRVRWQRAHTLAIVVIEAVFQAPMFALNAIALSNACGPSHMLSNGSMNPEPRRVRPVHCARRFQCAECVWSDAAGPRDAAQLRRLGGRNPEGDSMMLLLARLYTPEKSESRKRAYMPEIMFGAWPRGMAKQHCIPSQASQLEGR